MIKSAPDQYQEIRDAVRALSAQLPDAYHRKGDSRRSGFAATVYSPGPGGGGECGLCARRSRVGMGAAGVAGLPGKRMSGVRQHSAG